MYSPTLGRFMQTDPIGYGDGMNMYAYVGNDPVNGVDPTGWICWQLDGVTGYYPDLDRAACNALGLSWDPIFVTHIPNPLLPWDTVPIQINPTDIYPSLPVVDLLVKDCTGAGCEEPDPATWINDIEPCPLGINERSYAIPSGYTSAGQNGDRFIRDEYGVIQMNPNYAAARANSEGTDWGGVARDLSTIAGSVFITLKAGQIGGGSVYSWDVDDAARAANLVGSSGAKAVWGLPGGECFYKER